MNQADGQYVDYRGYRFTAPFICMCCGREVAIEQFCYGRQCGLCDTGLCQSWHRGHEPQWAHEKPAFWVRFGTNPSEGMARYAEAVGGRRIEAEDGYAVG